MFPFLNSLSILFLLLFFTTGERLWVLVALIILIINTFFEKFAGFLNEKLFKLTQKIGTSVSKVVLYFVYYLVLIPISFLFRKSKENPLYIRKPEGSLWIVRNKDFSKEDFEKPF